MKISMMLLKRRKKFTSIIVLVIMLMTMIELSTYIFTNSVLNYKWEKAIKSYGDFSCGLSGVSEEMKNTIKDQFGIANVGCYEIYQGVEMSEATLSLGYVDDVFREKAGVQLLEGRLPQKKDEVVIESFVANLLDNPEIIKIEKNGKMISLKIVGIVDNYSSRLSLPDEIQVGKNTYPNVISAEASLFDEQKQGCSLLIDMGSKINARRSYIENTRNIDNELQNIGVSLDDIFYNNNLLNKGLVSCHEIWIHSLFFSIIVIGVVSVGLYVLLCVFYKDYRSKFAVLEICGMERKNTFRIMFLQMIIMFVIGSGIGIVVTFIIKCAIDSIWKWETNWGFDNGIVLFIAGEIALVTVILLILFRYRVRSSKYSIAENLEKTSVFESYGNQSEKVMDSLRKPNIKVTILLTSVFLISYFSLYIYNIAIYDNPDIPDYQLYSKEVVTSEVVNGFTIENNPDSCILSSDVEKLEKYASDIVYETWPNFNSYSILLDQASYSEYFQTWNAMYRNEDTSYEESIIEKNWPDEMEGLTAVWNVDFVVASKTVLNEAIKEYKLNVTADELEKNNEIILFLPRSSELEIDIEEGENIKIGGVSQNGSNVEGELQEFSVGKIVKDAYSLKINGFEQKREGIIVMLTESTAKASSIFKGYRALSVYFNDGISEEKVQCIDDLIYEIAAKIQGGVLYSRKTNLENEKIFSSYNKVLAVALMSINLFFGIIVILIFVYQIVLKNKYLYGVLRVLGMSLRTNRLYLLTSIMKSLMIAYLLATAISFIFIGNKELYWYYLNHYMLSFMQTLLLSLMSCVMIRNMLSKMDISSMLRAD